MVYEAVRIHPGFHADLVVEDEVIVEMALHRNLTERPFHAAFLKATNSVLVAAIRWAFSSR